MIWSRYPLIAKTNMNISEYRAYIEVALDKCFLDFGDMPQARLAEAMRYSLLAGGKRLRPILVLEFCRISGGDIKKALPVACAVEMLHSYSLIHDDLPCMDNDDLRRGKPTNHKVYGECTAVLAGDALQAEAFGTILRSELPAERKAACAEILAGAVGLDGMCGGQYLDMTGEGKPLTENELNDINSRKTGALIVASCQMGVAAADGDSKRIEAAGIFGAALGAAFQIRDDMLDALSTDEELGKNVGSDAREQKNTYMALYGEEKCAEMVRRLTDHAKIVLSEQFEDTDFLLALADSLTERRY